MFGASWISLPWASRGSPLDEAPSLSTRIGLTSGVFSAGEKSATEGTQSHLGKGELQTHACESERATPQRVGSACARRHLEFSFRPLGHLLDYSLESCDLAQR